MRSRLLMLLAALLLAGAGTAAVLAYVSGAESRALEGKRAVTVLVAAERIPAGTTGERVRSGGYTEQVRMPAETVPADALGALDAALDTLQVTADVQPRQLLLRGMFAAPSPAAGGLEIPEGKLAVAVELSAAADVAGYVRPGTQVAVFDTFNVLKGEPGVPSGDRLAEGHTTDRATRVLLPRVQVLAVGPRPATAETGEAAEAEQEVERTLLVTVAVNQDEAERLVHAAQTGTLYLGLLTDTTDVGPGAGVDNRSLFR
ncbi:Flp pilus assembly protein CpaB [Planomonospora corallina]|uniref:Flp pilus assembly protein CpaB n=1 Tax=Planomonospora corallina TaxID=1806052 RepID=A0ABV8I7A9_9ACTN